MTSKKKYQTPTITEVQAETRRCEVPGCPNTAGYGLRVCEQHLREPATWSTVLRDEKVLRVEATKASLCP